MTVTEAPGAIVPMVQVKSSGSASVSQVPWLVETVPRVKPAGHVSDRLTPVAVEGPALVTMIVYV